MNDIDPEILKRYAAGLCSQEEQELVEQWLDTDEDISVPSLLAGIDKSSLKQEIWYEVRLDEPSRKKARRFPTLYQLAAACILLICFAGYFSVRFFPRTSNTQLTTASVLYKELSVPNGRKAQITLTDGTIIDLNGNSRLQYPAEFTGHTRVVYLSGEAHFKVAKNPAKPFIIHTAKTDTRVLGTVFNVKAYPEETNTVLTVEEGRVQFSLKADPSRRVILTANQQGIAGNHKALGRQQVFAANYSAWKDGKLIFTNLSLQEIAPLINRWYDVRVLNSSSDLSRERFTGTYERESLYTVAQDISQAWHCRFKFANKSLIFY